MTRALLLGSLLLLACGGDPTAADGGGDEGGGRDGAADSDGGGPRDAGPVDGGAPGDGGAILDAGPMDAGPPPPAVYVATDGDDGAEGTYEAPVATFARALAIREAAEEIRVFAGTYAERLRVDGSGTAAMPIRILAVPGARPVIDGTSLTSGQPVDLSGAFVEVGGFEVRASDNQCVRLAGTDLVARGRAPSTTTRCRSRSSSRTTSSSSPTGRRWWSRTPPAWPSTTTTGSARCPTAGATPRGRATSPATAASTGPRGDGPATTGSRRARTRGAGRPLTEGTTGLEGRSRGGEVDLGAMEYGDPTAACPFDARWP